MAFAAALHSSYDILRAYGTRYYGCMRCCKQAAAADWGWLCRVSRRLQLASASFLYHLSLYTLIASHIIAMTSIPESAAKAADTAMSRLF
nr:hypothetical protein CFP56_41360 [Quercus suber]